LQYRLEAQHGAHDDDERERDGNAMAGDVQAAAPGR
jgi:hypothetical protein